MVARLGSIPQGRESYEIYGKFQPSTLSSASWLDAIYVGGHVFSSEISYFIIIDEDCLKRNPLRKPISRHPPAHFNQVLARHKLPADTVITVLLMEQLETICSSDPLFKGVNLTPY